jgi:hypothetical protein
MPVASMPLQSTADRNREDERARSGSVPTHVLDRIINHSVNRIAELPRWNIGAGSLNATT